VTTIGVRACAACSTVPRETLPHRSDPHITDLGEAQQVFAYRNHRDRIVFSRCTYDARLSLFNRTRSSHQHKSSHRLLSSHHNPQEQCSDRHSIAPTTSSPQSLSSCSSSNDYRRSVTSAQGPSTCHLAPQLPPPHRVPEAQDRNPCYTWMRH
jgi:hypothetical protein